MTDSPYWTSRSANAGWLWVDALAGVAHAVNRGATEREIGDMIAKAATLLEGVDHAVVAVPEQESHGLRVIGAHGLTADYVEHIMTVRPLHFSDDNAYLGPSIRGFRSGRAVAVSDVTTDPAFTPWRQMAEEEGFRSLLAVPLVASDRTWGVLTCYCNDAGRIEQTQNDLIEVLAAHASIALESFETRRSQEQSIDELSAALAALELSRDLLDQLTDLVLEGADVPAILERAGEILEVDLKLSSEAADPAYSAILPGVTEDSEKQHLVADRLLTPRERPGLSAVAVVVAFERQRQLSLYQAEARSKLDLLSDLLELRPEDDTNELVDRCLRHGFDLSRPHRIAVLAADEHLPGAGRKLARLAENLAPRAAGQGRRSASHQNAVILSSYRHERAVVLISEIDIFEDFLDRVHAASQGDLGTTTCSMVVGTVCLAPLDYASSYRQAVATLDVRQRSGAKRFKAEIDDLGVLRFLLQGPPDELLAFSDRLLRPLLEASNRSHDSLLTLQTYFANRQRAGATARALHVHPNTVTNRLERIGQLTGGSMDNSDHLMNLRLALMVQEGVTSTDS
ncbi:MAG: helix-turn-helix domain-containing protein [Tomitella sp.]|nr:helix-turn-helix domain-containing protein [Tomitella sp.]